MFLSGDDSTRGDVISSVSGGVRCEDVSFVEVVPQTIDGDWLPEEHSSAVAFLFLGIDVSSSESMIRITS